jgi:hypothetical protein
MRPKFRFRNSDRKPDFPDGGFSGELTQQFGMCALRAPIT